MVRYLARHHPEVRRSHRVPLVVGASVGAQLVAQLHVASGCNLTSDDPAQRRIAHRALSVISTLNLGIRDSTCSIFSTSRPFNSAATAASSPATPTPSERPSSTPLDLSSGTSSTVRRQVYVAVDLEGGVVRPVAVDSDRGPF